MLSDKEMFLEFYENTNDGILGYRKKLFQNEDDCKEILAEAYFLNEPVKETNYDWNDTEKPKFYQCFLKALNKGVVVFNNIPKIPEEFDQDPKHEYFGFDSEDNGFGFPHFYQFASRNEVVFSMSYRLLLRYVIARYNMKKFNHIVWATNISYELGNTVKDMDINPDTIDIRWRRGGLVKFAYKYEQNKLSWGQKKDPKGWFVLWDTMNHWPISVEKQGNVLSSILKYDFTKLDKSFYSIRYSAMDAIISRAYACIQRAEYLRREIPLKLTQGGSAFEWFMKGETPDGQKYCDCRIYGTHLDSELEWMMPALRGGRTEVFSLKEHKGKTGYFDINSAYPHMMKTMVFPDIEDHSWVKGHDKIKAMIENGAEGIVECEVNTDNVNDVIKQIPYLAHKDPIQKRLIFPLGTWKDKYTIFEIRTAQMMGYEFKFYEAIVYNARKESPFLHYIDAAYGLRLEGARTGNQLLRDIGKSLGNNLFGKFGQRMVFTKLDDPANYSKKQLEDLKRIGGCVVIEEDAGFAKQANVVWSAYITAGTRYLLFKHIIAALSKGNEILYCDTDSIFITGGEWPESHPTNLGALKHEGDLTYFKALLPKTYIYEQEGIKIYKAKGVPDAERERFFVEGRVEYRKPMKLRESMTRKKFNPIDEAKGIKAGFSAANAWVTVTKQIRGKYTKRIVHDDLSTTPVVLG